jgi:hypothetical protein
VAKVTWLIAKGLAWPAVAFALLALAMKGRGAIESARRAASQTRTTLALYVFDFFLVGPPLGIAIVLIVSTVQRYGLTLMSDPTWSGLGPHVTTVLTLF